MPTHQSFLSWLVARTTHPALGLLPHYRTLRWCVWFEILVKVQILVLFGIPTFYLMLLVTMGVQTALGLLLGLVAEALLAGFLQVWTVDWYAYNTRFDELHQDPALSNHGAHRVKDKGNQDAWRVALSRLRTLRGLDSSERIIQAATAAAQMMGVYLTTIAALIVLTAWAEARLLFVFPTRLSCPQPIPSTAWFGCLWQEFAPRAPAQVWQLLRGAPPILYVFAGIVPLGIGIMLGLGIALLLRAPIIADRSLRREGHPAGSAGHSG